MKFGCCTGIENYDTLVELGYDFIELASYSLSKMSDEEFAEVSKKIKNGKIPAIGFNAYCGAETPLIGADADIAVTDAFADKMMTRGAELGIKNVGIGAPLARKLAEGFSYDVAYKQMQDAIRCICKRAAEHGITVLFEALNKEMSNFIITTEDAVNFVKELSDIENLEMVLDFYHMEVMDEGDDEAMLALPFTKHVHISQRDPNQVRSYLRYECVEQYEKQLSILKKYGYDGSLSIESSTDDFANDAKISLEILKNLFAQ